MSITEEEVTQPLHDSDDESANGSMGGPTTDSVALEGYTRLLCPELPMYTGSPDGISIREWEALMLVWMDGHDIPDRFRVRVGALKLRAVALVAWRRLMTREGKDVTWDKFISLLEEYFWGTERMKVFMRKCEVAKQRIGDSIIEYGERFHREVIENWPYEPVAETEKMIFYMKGLQPYFKIPQGTAQYSTYKELREAHEAYQDTEFFPDGRVPPVRLPNKRRRDGKAPMSDLGVFDLRSYYGPSSDTTEELLAHASFN